MLEGCRRASAPLFVAIGQALDEIAAAIPSELADRCDRFTERAWLALLTGGAAMIVAAMAVPA